MSDESIDRTLAAIRDLYTTNLATHGLSSKSVGWRDEASQVLRFERLAQVIRRDGHPEGFTVADWGCGYGAMYAYLQATCGDALREYVGYDISREMIASATTAHAGAQARFVLGGQVTDDADYTFVSGTFNVRFQATPEEWGQYIRRTLESLWARSRHGLAFNLLTSHLDWEQGDLFYANPGEYFDFCKRHLSRYVTLLHDYPLYEWTMLVRREGGA